MLGYWLRLQVEIADDERTSAAAVFNDLGRCLPLPADALIRSIVVIGLMWLADGSAYF